jgi:hypothetical protein
MIILLFLTGSVFLITGFMLYDSDFKYLFYGIGIISIIISITLMLQNYLNN